ncbi:hypothetical protein Cgig2_013440 [Carnegiea gigantea]|uniref:tRNA/rRNA methyltransferase SpoU type domain-containing protein n=1 Tax=Carnegiea gigantea TaxID=171969 RepID=A0A9Q1K6M3_9CARY|nr:hypothetical protein Cgig2_013440 [Carnegiea gigantea]
MTLCTTLARTSLLSSHNPLRRHHFSIIFPLSLSPYSSSHSLRQGFEWNRRRIRCRNFVSISEAIASENLESISEKSILEPAEDLGKDTVEQLLSPKNKDSVSKLMKMERKSSIGGNSGRWFPYLDKFGAGGVSLNSAKVLEAMEPHLMDSRKQRFRNVVKNRSYGVCLVVEGLTDFGNVSAAFRSADALGFQSVHVVSCDSSKRYRDNRHVSMGAEKWLDIEVWDSTRECFSILKSRGYRIATTHLGKETVSIYDMDWSYPTAIVVGNENRLSTLYWSETYRIYVPLYRDRTRDGSSGRRLWLILIHVLFRGISEDALELSDLHCSIPMNGMVDSFNVSVAAGIIMHHAVCDRRSRLGSHGDLTSEESQILLAEFCLRHSNSAISIACEYAKRKFSSPLPKL